MKKLIGACIKNSKTTAVKVGGGLVAGGGTVVGLIFFLHSNLKAEIKDKIALAQLANTAKVEVVAIQVAANNKLNEIKFKAVQNTINLQVQTVNQKMQTLQRGQTQVLKVLEKLDKRLYQLNKNSGG